MRAYVIACLVLVCLGACACASPAQNPVALNASWGSLTQLQYVVTRLNGTEPAFDNAYWDNHDPGIYVDVVNGDALFSSTDKYDSGTGWPSFTKPLVPQNIMTRSDDSLGIERTEVRSVGSDSHLGHLFDDGPAPTGLRYCMNSAALRFIPAKDLSKDGYGQYAALFNGTTQDENQ